MGIRDTDKPGKEAGGYLDPREEFLFIRVADDYGEVERKIGNEGKRVGGIETERREDGENLFDKKGVQRLFLLRIQLAVLVDEDACGSKPG